MAKLLLIPAFLMATLSWAYDAEERTPRAAHETPTEIQDVGVVEKLGQSLSKDLQFTDDQGQAVTLGQYFKSERPVIMAMIYYSCPNLCNFQLNGLIDVIHKMKGGVAGKDYDVVAVSMDHTETYDLAAKKKANYMDALKQPGAEKGWHFLVGSEENVKKLADELGFKFKWNDQIKQFAHAAATYIVTPQGMISRYLHGIEFSAATLRLSLVEASSGKIGNIVEQFALFCFQFNPSKSKYVLRSYNIMRLGALLTVLLLAVFLVPYWLREKNKQAPGA